MREQRSCCKWEDAWEHPTLLQNLSTLGLRQVTTQAIQLQERFSIFLQILEPELSLLLAKSSLPEVSLAKEWGNIVNSEGQKELALIPESSLF